MDFWHVKQMNYLSQVFNKLYMFSPEARVTSDIIDEDHQALKQVWVHNFTLMFCSDIDRGELRPIMLLRLIVDKNKVRTFLLNLIVLPSFGSIACLAFVQLSFDCAWKVYVVVVALAGSGFWRIVFVAAAVTIWVVNMSSSSFECPNSVGIAVLFNEYVQVLVHYKHNFSVAIQNVVKETLSDSWCVFLVINDLECFVKTYGSTFPDVVLFIVWKF